MAFTAGLRRPYAPGWLQRFFYPLLMAGALVVGSPVVVLGAAGIVVGGDKGMGLYVLALGAFWLLVGLIAYRARRIGIWTSEDEVVVRSLARTVRLRREQVVDVQSEPRGAYRLGSSACPVIYTASDEIVVRDLADASPIRWGGSTSATIAFALRQSLSS